MRQQFQQQFQQTLMASRASPNPATVPRRHLTPVSLHALPLPHAGVHGFGNLLVNAEVTIGKPPIPMIPMIPMYHCLSLLYVYSFGFPRIPCVGVRLICGHRWSTLVD